MVTSTEAEFLATQLIREYIAFCNCKTAEDVGNALLKFLSVTGQAILKTQGQEVAVAMVQGTAAHLAKSEFSTVTH